MSYADTELRIPHPIDEECNDKEIASTTYLQTLIDLDYLSFSNGSLGMTKSGYDYFMRKCSLDTDGKFNFDPFARMDIQHAIYEHFFKGKAKINTIEKFISKNINI